MADLEVIAPAFVEMAHRIVWASVASVDRANQPRSRILHPIWEWDGDRLTGWIATAPTPLKRAHLAHSPNLSVSYWDPTHDTAVAECSAEWCDDPDSRRETWDRFLGGPEPVGYDPSIVPGWTSPDVAEFSVLRLTPWRLRVMPGTVMLRGTGAVLTWPDASDTSR